MMQVSEILSIGISVFALIVSGLSFWYARRSHLMATVPEISIELDYFTYLTPREVSQGKIEPIAPYTHLSVMVHNDSRNVRVTDVKVQISIISRRFMRTGQENKIMEFGPFFIDPGQRTDRQKLFLEKPNPKGQGYYQLGIEHFLTEGRHRTLSKHIDDDTLLPLHYEIIGNQPVEIGITVDYSPGLFTAKAQRRQKRYVFEPQHDSNILTGWKIKDEH